MIVLSILFVFLSPTKSQVAMRDHTNGGRQREGFRVTMHLTVFKRIDISGHSFTAGGTDSTKVSNTDLRQNDILPCKQFLQLN